MAILDLIAPLPYSRAVTSLAERVPAKPVTVIVLVGLCLFLSGNWLLPLVDRDEPRFAEAAREMGQRREIVIPWFNNKYRFDKPPLIYWCQMVSYGALGENSFAARLPSALFAAGTSALLVLWGRRLGNVKAGFYAGLMLCTCLEFLVHGRFAVADMPMVFFSSLALWSGWEMTRPGTQAGKVWWLLFFASLGLGFLAKGPVAWLPLAGLGLVRWLHPQDFSLTPAKVVLGTVLTLGLVALWGVPALIATQGQFFKVGIGHHVIFRSFGVMEGHGGSGWLGFIALAPLYLATFFFSFFPWALRVPGTLRRWWPQRGQDLLGSYLLLQVAVVFGVFTLVRTKLPHYTMPALPAISLWLALRLDSERVPVQRLARWAGVMLLVTAVVTLAIFKAAQPYFVAANLWRQAQPYCGPNTELATIEFNEPSLVWEFRKGLTNYLQEISLDQAVPFLQKPGPRVLILPTGQLTAELQSAATNDVILRAVGLDTVRFKRIDLTAIVAPAR